MQFIPLIQSSLSHDPSEMNAKNFLSMLKTVVLLNIFVETMIFLGIWDVWIFEQKVQK